MGKFEQIIEARQKLCEFNETRQPPKADPKTGMTPDPAATPATGSAPAAPAPGAAAPATSAAPATPPAPAATTPAPAAPAPSATVDQNLAKVLGSNPAVYSAAVQALKTGTPLPKELETFDSNVISATIAAMNNNG